MDLLGDPPVFDVNDPDWKIHSRNPIAPPEYLGERARVENSIVALGCEIEGTVIHSVLSTGVVVEEGALVRDSIIMAGSVIKRGAAVLNSIVDENVEIREGASVGDGSPSITVLGRSMCIAAGSKIKGGEIIDRDYRGE